MTISSVQRVSALENFHCVYVLFVTQRVLDFHICNIVYSAGSISLCGNTVPEKLLVSRVLWIDPCTVLPTVHLCVCFHKSAITLSFLTMFEPLLYPHVQRPTYTCMLVEGTCFLRHKRQLFQTRVFVWHTLLSEVTPILLPQTCKSLAICLLT